MKKSFIEILGIISIFVLVVFTSGCTSTLSYNKSNVSFDYPSNWNVTNDTLDNSHIEVINESNETSIEYPQVNLNQTDGDGITTLERTLLMDSFDISANASNSSEYTLNGYDIIEHNHTSNSSFYRECFIIVGEGSDRETYFLQVISNSSNTCNNCYDTIINSICFY